MATESGTELKPPYVAYRSFANFIDGLRQTGIPDRIDRSVMPGYSGAAQSFLLLALKFFRLITDTGSPTDALKKLVEHKGAEKAILADIVKRSYGFIFNDDFNLKAATEAQMLDKFRDTGLGGETVRKCLSFFLQICEASDIAVSPYLKSQQRQSSTGTVPSPGRRPARRRKTENVRDDDNGGEPPAPARSLQELLLEKFPAFNPEWPEAMQAKWFASFEQFMAAAKKSDVKE